MQDVQFDWNYVDLTRNGIHRLAVAIVLVGSTVRGFVYRRDLGRACLDSIDSKVLSTSECAACWRLASILFELQDFFRRTMDCDTVPVWHSWMTTKKPFCALDLKEISEWVPKNSNETLSTNPLVHVHVRCCIRMCQNGMNTSDPKWWWENAHWIPAHVGTACWPAKRNRWIARKPAIDQHLNGGCHRVRYAVGICVRNWAILSRWEHRSLSLFDSTDPGEAWPMRTVELFDPIRRSNVSPPMCSCFRSGKQAQVIPLYPPVQ